MTPGDVGSYRQAGLDGLACLPCDPVLPGGTTVHRNSRGPEEPKSWLHWEFWPQRVFYIYIYMLVFFCFNKYIYVYVQYMCITCVCIYIWVVFMALNALTCDYTWVNLGFTQCHKPTGTFWG